MNITAKGLFSRGQLNEIMEASSRLAERDKEVWERAYNMGAKHGWHQGILLMLLVEAVNILCVWIAFR